MSAGVGAGAVCIVLTATVSVAADMSFTVRRDAATRFGDYKAALAGWLEGTRGTKIVFVENSGYDLSELRAMAETKAPGRVEFLSFVCPPFDGQLGKGYGEMLCLRYCLAHSVVLRGSVRFLKVTGRYFLKNGVQVLHSVARHEEAEVVCNLLDNLRWADSRAFGGSTAFLRDYLCPMLDEVNDSVGATFEHVLARAAHRVMADGRRWALLPVTLQVQGVSGSHGKAWQRSRKQEMKQSLRLRMLMRLLSTHPE